MANPFKQMSPDLEQQAKEAAKAKMKLDKKLEKLIAKTGGN